MDTPIGGQIQVSWQAPANNGDALRDYVLTPFRGGAPQAAITLPPGQTSYTYAAENGQDYSFTVSTSNKAGPSETSGASESVRSFGQPAQVPSASLEPTGTNNQVRVTHGTPSDNGQAINRFEYALNGGGFNRLPDSKVIGGLQNGTSYTVQVRACNTYCGPASGASNAATPYGPIGNPSVRGEKVGAQGVRFTITAPASGPNGRPLRHFQFNVNNEGWENVPGNGVVNRGSDYDQAFSIDVRYAVSGPDQETTASAGPVRTDPRPPPPPPVVPSVRNAREREAQRIDDGQGGVCVTTGRFQCAWNDMRYTDLPGGTYTLQHYENGGLVRTYSGVSLSGSGVYRGTRFSGFVDTNFTWCAEGAGQRICG
ncbi:fibronectin type III domain-containing protein [Litorihabitans aurantiacus]|uniref:Fibronectin type-III domain-containing protein n=1 Tax=Litorihabitans aurantiacus TaxID=1930061 RepID=A0AA37UV35_9MICO|nr:fibronectin type III domain-containing protein [Litorihabitans aurantiacus]GMA30966.1 hypothetical protein GCM10025875_09580 [Litorihabitans aurantiacus]